MGGTGSGGPRPNASQNNPANVSFNGGAGQSGKNMQPKFMDGMKALNQKPPATEGGGSSGGGGFEKALGTFFDPSNNEAEPISAGVDFGRGGGSKLLPKNLSADTRQSENATIVTQYLPLIQAAAKMPEATDSFKRFANFLASV